MGVTNNKKYGRPGRMNKSNDPPIIDVIHNPNHSWKGLTEISFKKYS